MKKLKEKFNNNEKIKLIKELWSNKKTRAWVWLGAYFIFFLVLSILMRMDPVSDAPATSSEIDNKSDISTIILNLENLSKSNYQYKLLINSEELNGKVENGTNSFIYAEQEYVFVYNKLYLNKELDLELVENFLNSEIPVAFINLEYILKSINDIQYEIDSTINQDYEVIYRILASDFLNSINEDKLSLKLIGRDNVTNKIVISYKDNNYILEII